MESFHCNRKEPLQVDKVIQFSLRRAAGNMKELIVWMQSMWTGATSLAEQVREDVDLKNGVLKVLRDAAIISMAPMSRSNSSCHETEKRVTWHHRRGW